MSWRVFGTMNQSLPVANTEDISVEPMPVAKAPKAPTVGAGVGIGAHHEAARKGMALFRKDLVAYPAEYIVVEDTLIYRKLPEQDVVLSCLETVRRHLVIEEKDDLPRVPYLGALACDLIEALDCQGACDVVNHGTVYVCHDKIACMGIFSRSTGKDLLGEGSTGHGQGHLGDHK